MSDFNFTQGCLFVDAKSISVHPIKYKQFLVAVHFQTCHENLQVQSYNHLQHQA